MNFKFKIGDKIHVKFTEMFSNCFGTGIASPGINRIVIDRRVHPDGKNQYKLRGFTGWWDEVTLQEV